MKTLELAENLIKIPSEMHSIEPLKQCIDYCVDYFSAYPNAKIRREEFNGKHSVLIANHEGTSFDVLSVGHIDVVPVEDRSMFNPVVRDGRLYGRGAIDMKSQVAVSMKMMEQVLKNNMDGIRFGILIVSDEEGGGENGAARWSSELGLSGRIILDYDHGNKIDLITNKMKGCVRCRLVFKGLGAHGSQPWLGVDANENLMLTMANLRRHFPYMSKENPPADHWVSTVHAGVICGGKAINNICPEAEMQLDFRITEQYTEEDVLEILKSCYVGDVEYHYVQGGIMAATNMDSQYLKSYIKIAEDIIGKKVDFEHKNWMTDARYFAKEAEAVIMHGPTGHGLHSADEWVDLEALGQFERIQMKFLEAVAGGVGKSY